MNEMRKLMESVEQIEEGYFSRLATEMDELYRANPNTPDENLIAFVSKKHGEEAADFFRSQIESGEYEQSLEEGDSEITYLKYPEGYEPPPAPKKNILDKYDWTMYLPNDVLSMMDSFIHKMKSQNVWDKGVELAGGEEQLLRSTQYEAEHVMEMYRDSGEGIGTSDINHFVRSIFRDLGEDDIWGWDKPKIASDEEMERDKAVRGMKAGKAIRAGESIEEDMGAVMGGISGLVIGMLILDTTLYPAMAKGNGFRWSPFYLRKLARKVYSLGAGDDFKAVQAKIKDTTGSYRELYHLAHNGDMEGFAQKIENIVGDGELDKLERATRLAYDKFRFDTPTPRESIEEAEEDTWAGGGDNNFATYEDYEKWIGQTVKIERTISGEHVGETGKVIKGDKYRDENGSWQAEFEIKLHSGPVITMYPGEWSYDQFNLAYDPTVRPDGKYDPELEEEVVEVPAGLRGEEAEVDGATSQDAERFLSGLGPDDSVDTNVVDPETGDLLDWPTKDERRKQDNDEYLRRQEIEKQSDDWIDDNTPWFVAFDIPPHSDKAWDRINELRFDREFTDHYDIVWKNMEDMVDDPDQYYEGDYDISVDMPVQIKRTDGEKFNSRDHKNFKGINDAFRKATYNIGVSYSGTADKGTVAHFHPSFY